MIQMLSFHSALFHQVSITSLKAAYMSEDGSQVIRNNLSPSPEKKTILILLTGGLPRHGS